jgi:thioredoxin-dependent peroxiredoxin
MEIKSKAPDFTLPDENRNPVSLAQFRGQNVVLFFYPRANTPG